MADKLAYLTTPGTIDSLFKKIKEAAVPERFDQDFLEKTLSLKGGAGRACIPFLKRLGFLKSDGTPTDNYRSFRNNTLSGAIVASSMKNLYIEIFKVNEDAHKLSEADIKAIIVQVTGLPADSRTVDLTLSTFKYLKKHAKFDAQLPKPAEKETTPSSESQNEENQSHSVNLSYTFYLNLPNTTDIAVFNAIFKALKENMLVK